MFHREGKKFTRDQIHDIIMAADPESNGKLSFDDFVRIMKDVL